MRLHVGVGAPLARLPSWLVALDAEVLRQSDRAGCLEPVVSMAVLLVSASTVLNEQQPVPAEMAVRFGKLFGNGAGFWANLQRSYDLAVAERTVDVSGIPTLAVRG